jgi:hypothetical protein
MPPPPCVAGEAAGERTKQKSLELHQARGVARQRLFRLTINISIDYLWRADSRLIFIDLHLPFCLGFDKFDSGRV